MTTAHMTGVPAARDDTHEVRHIPIVTFGLALSAFFVLSYLICILGYLLLPGCRSIMPPWASSCPALRC